MVSNFSSISGLNNKDLPVDLTSISSSMMSIDSILGMNKKDSISLLKSTTGDTTAIGSMICSGSKDGIGSSTESYDFGWRSNGNPYVAISDGTWAEYTIDSPIETNKWVYIAAVRDSSNNLNFYIDGKLNKLGSV